jgi:hypothetical protein
MTVTLKKIKVYFCDAELKEKSFVYNRALMKKVLLTAYLFFIAVVFVNSQNPGIPGKMIAEIFTDFHYSLAGAPATTGFSLNRAYFGYNYIADENFSAILKVNVGTPEDLAPGSVARRYAHFTEASITYIKDKLNLTLGMTNTRLFNYQQRFWGKRYIANTYQSINGYGFIADLGLVADYKFNDIVEGDITIMNGEGYSNIQLDNNIKPSVGITITPTRELAIRAYSDIMKTDGLWQATMVCFAGYKNEKLTIGAEISYKSNLDLHKGHDGWGISGTGAVSLTKRIEFFSRYDYSTSVISPGEGIQWNLARDGQFLISGFQYTFNKIVKVAFDYQATFPKDKTRTFSDLVYVNALYKF